MINKLLLEKKDINYLVKLMRIPFKLFIRSIKPIANGLIKIRFNLNIKSEIEKKYFRR